MEGKGRRVLTWTERIQIEALLKAKHTPKEIAAQLGKHYSTIYRELHRGILTGRKKKFTALIWRKGNMKKG